MMLPVFHIVHLLFYYYVRSFFTLSMAFLLPFFHRLHGLVVAIIFSNIYMPSYRVQCFERVFFIVPSFSLTLSMLHAPSSLSLKCVPSPIYYGNARVSCSLLTLKLCLLNRDHNCMGDINYIRCWCSCMTYVMLFSLNTSKS